jgi:UDP-N-acetylmuramyl pentapeptide phosphotransferase/UDP-N-acetylglucosamine-1-phosphate transferase
MQMPIADFQLAFICALGATFVVASAIVATQRLHGHLTSDSVVGIQKFHRVPTPRVGGIALICGALAGGLTLAHDMQMLFLIICLSLLPAFFSGLAEDVTKTVNVSKRLLATMVSGLIFSLASGYVILPLGIPGADWLLGFWLFALLFTAFAIAGIANAINIVDGFNGLAGGTAIICMSCYGLLAWQVGDTALLGVAIVTVGILLGFVLVNFPFGKIFLGDSGAYTVGFLLAVMGVALPARNADISPLIGLLVLSYPVIETMVSIWRRTHREGTNPGQPDRLHLHSLVHRSWARALARRLGRPDLRNPATSVILWGLPILSSVLSVIAEKYEQAIPAFILLMFLVYIGFYRRAALLKPLIWRIV